MQINVTVPELGESIVEATIVRWLKSEGDPVRIGESLVELETEKANFEVAAEKEGILKSITKRESVDIEVGDVIGIIEEGEPSTGVGDIIESTEVSEEKLVATETINKVESQEEPLHDKITPVARRIAQDNNVDLDKVRGSGASGRITKEDVEKYMKERVTSKELESSTSETTTQPAVLVSQKAPLSPIAKEDRREERVKMSRRRRTIARRMLESAQSTAMLTTFNEIDMGAVMSLRKSHKESFKEKYGVSLGLNSFFVKATIGALKEFAVLNAEIEEDTMILKRYYDIGIAIGASEGLVVPVLRNADGMSFAEIEKRIKNFAQKAEDNSLSLEDIMGGTFTITNGGVFGSMMSTPILNPPQVGILGLHRIEERPIVINGNIEIRPMMYVALSYDHRIVDGREAVQFLVKVKELVEYPEILLLEG